MNKATLISNIISVSNVGFDTLCRASAKLAEAAHAARAHVDVPNRHFNQVFVDSWFLKPISRRGLRIGSVNETSILDWMPEFVERHMEGFVLVANRRIGIAQRRGRSSSRQMAEAESSPYVPDDVVESGVVCTSVDAVALFQVADGTCAYIDNVNADDKVDNIEPGFHAIMASHEMKTHSSVQSMEDIRYIRDTYGRFNIVNIEHDIERFHHLVPNASYRSQDLHHDSTMGMIVIISLSKCHAYLQSRDRFWIRVSMGVYSA